MYVSGEFASSLCLATAIRSFIRLRRDLLFINNLRRIISVSLLRTNPLFKQLVARNDHSLQYLIFSLSASWLGDLFSGFFRNDLRMRTSFRRKRHRRPCVSFYCERSLPNKLSQKVDLFKIPSTPGADQQVQPEFQILGHTQLPFQRFRHQRNHLPARLKRAQ